MMSVPLYTTLFDKQPKAQLLSAKHFYLAVNHFAPQISDSE
jgi:hypothetical protein